MRAVVGVLLLPVVLVGCKATSTFAPPGPCDPGPLHESLHSFPAWSPDGQRLAFVGSVDSAGRFAPGVYIVDLLRRRTTLVDSLSGHFLDWIDQVAWSPDGTRLLIRRSGRFWLVDLRDRSWVRVPTDPGRLHWDASWSPGGDSIFYRREGNQSEPRWLGGLYSVDLRSGAISRFTYQDTGSVWNAGPVLFSPDGHWMAYSEGIRREDGFSHAHEIFIVDMVTKVRRQITWLDGSAQNPMWVDGGRAIVFDFSRRECENTGTPLRQSWRVRPDGTDVEPLRDDLGGNSVQFGWPPAIDRRGRRAAFIGLDPWLGYGVLKVTDIHRFDPRPVYEWQRVEIP